MSASGPTRSPINVVDLRQAKQPDGNIKTTAKVTAQENLGLGDMDIASPDTMLLGETRTVRLRLPPSQQIASAMPVPAPGKTPDLPSFVFRFGGNIDLYLVMYAELRTLAFDVDNRGPSGVTFRRRRQRSGIGSSVRARPGNKRSQSKFRFPLSSTAWALN